MTNSTPPSRLNRPLTWLGSFSLLLWLVGCAAPQGEGDWAQWRGPNGAGVSTLGDLPVDWGQNGKNVKWKIKPPARGVSQPIVIDGRIYLTGSRGGRGPIERTVAALDLEDGSLLWETIISERRGERKHHRFGSHSTPTSVSDGSTVWAYFGGYLAALSLEGELLWRVTVDESYWTTSRYGAASSPILAGRAVIVFSDDEWGDEGKRSRSSWMAAYDRESGEEMWRNTWEDTCCSYATPVLRHGGDDLEIVIATTPFILGFDAATGERLWQLDLDVTQVVPGLAVSGDMLIQAGAVHNKKIVAYRVEGTGTATHGERVWEEKRASPELASPVVYQDLLFTVSPGGIMTCFEPQTGELVWRDRLPKGDYRSAMVAGDGKLYVMSLGGITYVVEAGREFRLLATNDLAEFTESSIALAAGCLLVRTEDHLYCIEQGSGPPDS